MDDKAGNTSRSGRGFSLILALILLGTLAAALAPRADAYIYWARGAGGGVGRANVDGSDVRPKFVPGSGSGGDCGVAIDSAHIYWVNRLTQTGQSVGRANLDGTGVNQNFIPAARSMPCGPAVDDMHVYWANTFSKSIARADIDGRNADQSFITNQFLPCQVAVDGSHIYWSPGIIRANLDGTGVQSIVPGAGGCGVAVDGSHIYFVKDGSHQGDPGTIWQANLDGTGVQRIVGNAGDPCGVAVDGKYVYWMDKNFGDIDRATLDGQKVQIRFIQTGAVRQACGVAVDQAGPGAGGLRLGHAELNRSSGFAKLPARVDGAGTLKLRAKGHGLNRVSRDVRSAGKVKLPVTPRGRKQRRLRRNGTARVEARVTFTSANGFSTTRARKIKLVRR